MAFVGQGVKVIMHLTDLDDDDSNPQLKLIDTEATYATAETAAGTAAAEFASVSGMYIAGYTVSQRFNNDTGGPYGTQQRERQAAVKVLLHPAESGKQHIMYIPAVLPAVQVGTSGPNAKIIDTANADIAAWVALFRNTTGVFSLSDGEQVLATGGILEGHVITRKNVQF